MLTPIGKNIWIADGATVSVLGFRYPTRTAIIKLADGGLFVWSPIALTEELRQAVDAIGPIQHLIAPNSLHHLFIKEWQQAYPQAKAFAAPKLRKKRPDLRFDADLFDHSDDGWDGQIDQMIVPGNLITTEVVFFHRASQTVIFTDLLQQFPLGWHKGWRGIIAKLDLMTEAQPSVPRKFRAAFVDRRAARTAINAILSWPTVQVIMAHGTPITHDGQTFLRDAFSWLTKNSHRNQATP